MSASADAVHDLRAARREAVRAAALAKTDGGAPFGLLVIPVDFADARFAAPPDLAGPLSSRDPGTLTHYFDVASQGRTRLAPVVAPPVSLAGRRLDYSDIGWQGNARTRRLAREALAGARAAGVVFADADRDGDGEVDGVLLLHAAPGLENDPDGWIVPLQFFLAEPVVESGTVARSYAVASARSTLGIQAHETGHLLGLEDRYDPTLSGSGETGPRGGLGRFSLMAAGWRGSGAGRDPALPDGYSRWLLGWADLDTTLTAGAVVRLRALPDTDGTEWFLAERRGGDAASIYDVDLGDDRALVYHVDEGVPEGAVAAPAGEPAHMRVQLVEADGGDELRTGLDAGAASDLFPSGATSQSFDETTWPSSRRWDGSPTGVEVRFVDPADGPVRLDDLATWIAATVRLGFPPAGESGAVDVMVRLAPGGDVPPTLAAGIALRGEGWGRFAGDGEEDAEIVVELAPAGEPGWATHVAADPPSWLAEPVVPANAVSEFAVRVVGAASVALVRHPWHRDHAPVAIDATWDDRWAVDAGPGGGTTWHRWAQLPGVAPFVGPLAACTAAEHADGADWPEVRYGNGAHARLTTPLLGTDVRWLAFTHAVDVELLQPGVAVDAATVRWVDADGRVVPATPADGWPGHVDPRSGHDLAGADAFGLADSLRGDATPLWRREVVAVPDPTRHGPGPWRLRFEFASNDVWRGRGWLLWDVAAGTDAPPAAGFAVWRDGAELRWRAPAGVTPASYGVEVRDSDRGPWRQAATVDGGPATAVPLAGLDLAPGTRHRIRVIAYAGQPVASRDLVITGTAGAPALPPPRPNPARTVMRIAVDGAGDPRALLAAYDLRGRLVRRWAVGAEAGQVVWEGRDRHGRRIASGVYILRLEAHGRTRTHKVTWLH